jgi:Tfp pilus assembly protein PilV
MQIVLSRKSTANAARNGGFTLLEVMIASGILFMCLFAILQLLSASLRNARSLQRNTVDAGMLAIELMQTNKLSEGSDSGDFGKLYPEYHWSREINEVGTNGLFQADFVVYRRSAQNPESRLSVLYFKPGSITPGRIR